MTALEMLIASGHVHPLRNGIDFFKLADKSRKYHHLFAKKLDKVVIFIDKPLLRLHFHGLGPFQSVALPDLINPSKYFDLQLKNITFVPIKEDVLDLFADIQTITRDSKQRLNDINIFNYKELCILKRFMPEKFWIRVAILL